MPVETRTRRQVPHGRRDTWRRAPERRLSGPRRRAARVCRASGALSNATSAPRSSADRGAIGRVSSAIQEQNLVETRVLRVANHDGGEHRDRRIAFWIGFGPLASSDPQSSGSRCHAGRSASRRAPRDLPRARPEMSPRSAHAHSRADCRARPQPGRGRPSPDPLRPRARRTCTGLAASPSHRSEIRTAAARTSRD